MCTNLLKEILSSSKFKLKYLRQPKQTFKSQSNDIWNLEEVFRFCFEKTLIKEEIEISRAFFKKYIRIEFNSADSAEEMITTGYKKSNTRFSRHIFMSFVFSVGTLYVIQICKYLFSMATRRSDLS